MNLLCVFFPVDQVCIKDSTVQHNKVKKGNNIKVWFLTEPNSHLLSRRLLQDVHPRLTGVGTGAGTGAGSGAGIGPSLRFVFRPCVDDENCRFKEYKE